MATPEGGPLPGNRPPAETHVEDDSSTSLIEKARAGEAGALDELIETWRTYLLYVANGAMEQELKQKLGASDLVQSACIDIYRHFHEFQGETVGEWKTWLRRLLLRDMQDVRRRYRDTGKRDIQRERLGGGAESDWDAPDDEASPLASLIAAEEASLLRSAMQRLPDEYRTVLKLRSWDQLTFSEVGRLLNKSEEATRKLWSRAVERLQTELQQLTDES